MPGTLSHLSLFHTHFQWELFVHQKDLQKICGIRATDVESALREKDKIEAHLNRHIRMQTGKEVLKGNLSGLRAQAPNYWVLTLHFPFQNEPESFKAEYAFENTFDGSDRTTLVFYDHRGEERGEKKDPWITILHDSRKMANWTPEGLENALLPDAAPMGKFPWLFVTGMAAALWAFPVRGGGIWRGHA